MVVRVLVQLLGSEGARARVISVLCECIWNAPAVVLLLPAFDDSGSLGSPPRRVVYTRGSTLSDCPSFLAGNKEAELKPTPSSLLLFRYFLFFLFS